MDYLNLLLREGAYQSCEILSSFLLNDTFDAFSDPGNQCQMYKSLCEAHFQQGNYTQAIYFGDRIVKNYESIRSQQNLGTEFLYDIQGLLAQCHAKLETEDHFSLALELLEQIPSDCRHLRHHLLLARLYLLRRNKLQAALVLFSVLKKWPFALEALVDLLELGASATPPEVKTLFHDLPDTFKWIIQLANALSFLGSNRYVESREILLNLLKRFPSAVFLLTKVAETYVRTDMHESALAIFSDISRADPYTLSGQDLHSSCLFRLGRSPQIRQLALHAAQLNVLRPQYWLILAHYCAVTAKSQKSLEYATRAISLDPLYAESFLLKGLLSLKNNHIAEAKQAFLSAFQLKPTFQAAQALIEACMVEDEIKEALTISQHLQKMFPNSHKAIALHALVLSHIPDQRKLALQLFQRALSLDKMCLQTIIGLADLYIVQGNFQKAINLLLETLKTQNKDYVHLKLGDAYTKISNYTLARKHYNSALILNPNLAEAKKCIKVLDKNEEKD